MTAAELARGEWLHAHLPPDELAAWDEPSELDGDAELAYLLGPDNS